MIPTIGLMVAAAGATVCCYVAARCVEIMSGEEDITPIGVSAGFTFGVAILALVAIVILTRDLIALAELQGELLN